eukprot:7344855-Prymnesium_polylepis.2
MGPALHHWQQCALSLTLATTSADARQQYEGRLVRSALTSWSAWLQLPGLVANIISCKVAISRWSCRAVAAREIFERCKENQHMASVHHASR